MFQRVVNFNLPIFRNRLLHIPEILLLTYLFKIMSNVKDGTVKQRILQLLKAKRMTQTEFTRHLGVSSTYLGAMRKSMPEEKFKKVFELFPDVNRDWLLYGEGMMLRPKTEVREESEYMVPLLPVEAYAGRLQNWCTGVQLRDCEKIVSPVPGVDFAIRINGNSMEPDFRGGSVIYIKRINERAFIPWGNPMVVDTENGVLVKVLYPVEGSEEMLEARSYNPAYPPFRIPTESIYGIYRVVSNYRECSTN